MVAITGGEPLLRKDLEQIGQELQKRGFPWGFVTNGYYLSQERLSDLVFSGLRSLTLSLDGLQDSHDWFRNKKGSFERAMDVIRNVRQYPHLTFDVVTCVNQFNLNELSQIKDLLISHGVKKWRIFTIFPKGRAAKNEQLCLTDEQFIQIFEFIKTTRKLGQIQVNYGCEGFLGTYELEARDYAFFCRAGINVLSVLADGSISACPSLRGDYIQGNIYRDDIVDVWENRFQVMRDRSWTKTGECERCSSFRYCNGNGLHLRDQRQGLLFCHIKRMGQ